MFLPSGTVIDGKYRLLGVLGTGGFGTVYRASQLEFEREVALKMLNPDALDAEAKARFLREAQILNQLNHRNITRFYGHGKYRGSHFLVMEYVDGKSLQEALAPNQPLPCKEVVALTRQVADGLACAHAHGVIHRDLKPSNIILSATANGDLLVKVIDFGLAKIVSAASGQMQELTNMGQAVGTTMYMSPEQCHGRPADSRSDLYALGCILYHGLTGMPPFVGDSAVALMFQHVNQQAPRLVAETTADGKLIQSLQQVIDCCMQKIPADRFQTAGELNGALTALEILAPESPLCPPSCDALRRPSDPVNVAHGKSDAAGRLRATIGPLVLGTILAVTLALMPLARTNEQLAKLVFDKTHNLLSRSPLFAPLLQWSFGTVAAKPHINLDEPLLKDICSVFAQDTTLDRDSIMLALQEPMKSLVEEGRTSDARQMCAVFIPLLDEDVYRKATSLQVERTLKSLLKRRPLVDMVETPTSVSRALLYITIASDYFLLGDLDGAIDNYKQILETAKEDEDIRMLLFSSAADATGQLLKKAKPVTAHRFLALTLRVWSYGVEKSFVMPLQRPPTFRTQGETQRTVYDLVRNYLQLRGPAVVDSNDLGDLREALSLGCKRVSQPAYAHLALAAVLRANGDIRNADLNCAAAARAIAQTDNQNRDLQDALKEEEEKIAAAASTGAR